MDRKQKSEMSNQEIAEGLVQRFVDRINGTSQPAQRDDKSHLSNQQIAEGLVQRFVDKFKPQEHSTNKGTAMANLNVENYSRQVIDSYRTNAQDGVDLSTARAITTYAASSIAADEGRARIGDAAKLANTTIDTFRRQVENGIPIEKARENVSQQMAARFDERGREVSKERNRSNEMSL